MTAELTFGSAPGLAYLDESQEAWRLPRSTGSGAYGDGDSKFPRLPFRDWIDGDYTWNPDTQKADLPNEKVYYLFGNPSDSIEDDPIYTRFYQINTSYNRVEGITEKFPPSLRSIPIADPQYTKTGETKDGKPIFDRKFLQDPMLGIFAPDKDGKRPFATQAFITPYLKLDGEDGPEVRFLEFRKTQYTRFLKWVRDQKRRNPDFNVAGLPLRIKKDDTDIDVWVDEDQPTLDMSKESHPLDARAYLLDLRGQVEDYLARKGVTLDGVDAPEQTLTEKKPAPWEVTDESSLTSTVADLAAMKTPELIDLAKEHGIDVGQRPQRASLIRKINAEFQRKN